MRRRKGRGAGSSAVMLLCALLSCLAWGSAPPASQPPGTGRGGPPPQPVTIPKPVFASAEPVRSCESLRSVVLPDTSIDVAVEEPGDERIAPSCRVTATVTHPPAGDRIKVFIGLPLKSWNGRFQGVGGGGFSGGNANAIRQPLSAGYAAGATDTGHEGGSGSFALDASGRLNWHAIRDNAYLGIHEMTVLGKALTAEFYGKPPRYSYFNGCSTGGRQGLSEAQRYPADYDGILSGAPAINWPKLHVEQLWGPLVMLEAKHFVPMCKLEAATAAAVAACDGIDGVKDGVLEDPRRCTFEAKALVGTVPNACDAITETDASVIRKIWEGPKRRDGSFLWYGLPRGAGFALSATDGSPLTARPSGITLDWFKYFLTQNPQWDWSTLTWASYEQLWDQSVEQFGPVFGTDNPNLSAFKDRGGKLLLWHGWADPLIYAEGTIDYFSRVQQAMDGPQKTATFIRLFMAPGVGHCSGGTGPAPRQPFDSLVAWVEQGEAPETLTAVRRDETGKVVRSRPLCAYPLVARYKGHGSTDEASSFECKAHF
ncbi:MAG TPA: tannase/feruloyl esterase family alpha/beta hydrolase [Vicinamibacterales bacterium]